MNPRRAHHVVDEGHPVDDITERRDGVGEHLAALPVGLEVPDRFEPRSEAVLKGLDRLAEVALLAVPLHELRLVVPEIDVAGGTGHEQLHDPLRLDGENEGRMRGSGRGRLTGEERREGHPPEATSGGGEPAAAREGRFVAVWKCRASVKCRCHGGSGGCQSDRAAESISR